MKVHEINKLEIFLFFHISPKLFVELFLFHYNQRGNDICHQERCISYTFYPKPNLKRVIGSAPLQHVRNGDGRTSGFILQAVDAVSVVIVCT